MPYWKNRVLKSCLAGGVLTALLLLAVLPSTRAWYTSRETGEGSTIMTANFRGEARVKTTQKSQNFTSTQETQNFTSTYASNGEANEASDAPSFEYEVTTITLTADGTASSGYFIVTFDGEDYYSDAVEPGDEVSFTLFGQYGERDYDVTSCWGTPPEDGLTLDDLADHETEKYEIALGAAYDAYEEWLAEQQRLAEQQAAEEADTTEPGAADPEAGETVVNSPTAD